MREKYRGPLKLLIWVGSNLHTDEDPYQISLQIIWWWTRRIATAPAPFSDQVWYMLFDNHPLDMFGGVHLDLTQGSCWVVVWSSGRSLWVWLACEKYLVKDVNVLLQFYWKCFFLSKRRGGFHQGKVAGLRMLVSGGVIARRANGQSGGRNGRQAHF